MSQLIKKMKEMNEERRHDEDTEEDKVKKRY